MARRVHDEEGVIAILVAILLPVMLAAAGFGLGTLLLTGGERELQRTTDAAALAAAASLPLADLNAANRAQATARACTVVDDNLEAATIAQGFGHGDSASCDNAGVTVTYEAELADVVGLQDDVAALHDDLEDALAVSVDETIEVCIEEEDPLLGITVEVCTETTVGLETSITPPVDLSDSIPALLTPRARVTARHALDTPLGTLIGEDFGTNDVAAQSVARRRLKNAVLLPVANCPGLEASLTSGGASATLLGHSARMGELRIAVQAHCNLSDPNTYADVVGGIGFGALENVAARLAQLVPGAGEVPGCLLGGLSQDLRDVYDPPAGGPAPTAQDIVASASAADEDVLLILSGVVGALEIPAFDMLAVPASDLAAGDLSNVRDWPSARGLFRASLIDEHADNTMLGCLGL